MAQYLVALLFGIIPLFGDIFLVSYRAQVKDATLLHESLYASKAMTATHKIAQVSQTIFLTKSCKQEDFFRCYEEEILDFLYTQQALIQTHDTTQSLCTRSFLELNIPPLYLKVDFNDTFAKIALLK